MQRSLAHAIRFLLLPAATLTLLVAGCPAPGPNGTSSGNNKATVLKPFSSSTEMVDYVRTRATASYGSFGVFRTADLATAGAETNGAAVPATADDSSGASQSFSKTNTQEEGVDESDVFKSDGKNFYLAKGNSLRVVKATPQSDLAEVGRLDFEQRIDSMYLVNGKLILLTQDYGYPGAWDIALPAIWPPYFTGGNTIVYEIDIADAANPKIAKKAEFDGSLVTSRITGGRLLLVLNIIPKIATPLTIFTPLAIDDVLPKVRTSAGESATLDFSGVYHPDAPNGWYMTSVTTVDASDIENVLGATAVMANAGTIYVSTDALYLTDTDYDESDNFRETTSIHKFALGGDGMATYVASGVVDGRLLNQFSLGENDGYLRLATHIEPPLPVGVFTVEDGPTNSSSGSAATATAPQATAQSADAAPPVASNAVFVLGQDGGELTVVGQVTGIAPTERIYSARFLGNAAFLVTFKQIDPLFALDMSDPTKPQIVGELKIPGYSDYLHPISDKLLLGLGRSTATTPWGGTIPDKLQLSLFDISDLAKPTVIQQISLGGYGSNSEANYNHKAFTYLPESGLLALPVTLTQADYLPWFSSTFVEAKYQTGVAAYVVSETGFTLKGFLDDSGDASKQDWWWPEWRRAAVIGDTLYAANPLRVTAAPLADTTARTSVELAPNPDQVFPLEEGDIKPAAVDGATR